MKKLFLAIAMMLGIVSFSTAQKTDSTAKKAKVTTKKTTTSATAATPATAPKTVVLKKDGTPDKRYKTADSTKGPLKKDGTPDKRYKANKKQ